MYDSSQRIVAHGEWRWDRKRIAACTYLLGFLLGGLSGLLASSALGQTGEGGRLSGGESRHCFVAHGCLRNRGGNWSPGDAEVSDTLGAECVSIPEVDGVTAHGKNFCRDLGGWLPFTPAWVSGRSSPAGPTDHALRYAGSGWLRTGKNLLDLSASERSMSVIAPGSVQKDAAAADVQLGTMLGADVIRVVPSGRDQEGLMGVSPQVIRKAETRMRADEPGMDRTIAAFDEPAGTNARVKHSLAGCDLPGREYEGLHLCLEGGGPYSIQHQFSLISGVANSTNDLNMPASGRGREAPPGSSENDVGIQDRELSVTCCVGTATEGTTVNDMPVPANADYEMIENFTVTAPQNAQVVTVPFELTVYDDSMIEDQNENITLQVFDAASLMLLGGFNVLIVDDDLPYLRFKESDYSVEECSESVQVQVILLNSSTDMVTVGVNTRRGIRNGATVGVDFIAVSETLTFNPGETEKTVEIEIVADEIPAGSSGEGPEEYFRVEMTSPSATARLFPTPVFDPNNSYEDYTTVEIKDESGCRPILTVEDQSANEADGVIDFGVKLDYHQGADIRVMYETTDVTAVAGSDYVAVPETEILFTQDEEKTISVTVTDDSIVENDETFQVTFASLTHSELTTSAVGTILNDDTPVISIAGGDTVTEGETATFTIKAAPAPATSLTVNLTVAQSGEFVATGDLGTKTVAIGTSGTAPYTVATVDDEVNESDGTVRITVETGSGYDPADAPDDVGSVVVQDNDVLVVSVTGGIAVTEGGHATFTVKVAPAPATSLTVSLNVAQDGDFVGIGELGSKTVEISTSGTADYTVPTVNDDSDEPDGAVIVEVQSGSRYVPADDPDNVGTVVVQDDDSPMVSITGGNAVTEGGTAMFTVSAVQAPATTLTLNLTVAQTGDFAAAGELGSKTIEIGTSGTNNYTVATVQDEVDESDGTITATLQMGMGYVVSDSPDDEATVKVADDDTRGLRTAPTALTVLEGASRTYRVNLETMPTGTVTVTIESDNPGVTPSQTPLKFTITDWDTEQTVTVEAAEDADKDDDSATLMHTASGGDYDSVTGAVTVAVKDNDSAAGLVVSPTYLSVTEGTEEQFTVQLLAEPTQAVDVRISGDAETDLVANPTSLRFTSDNWSTPVTVTVRADEDEDTEDESIRLTLSASGGEYNGVTEVVEIDIPDNDVAEIKLSPAGLAVPEGDEASYTVRLLAEPSGTVTVEIASDDTDLAVSDASLSFTADDWDTEQTVAARAREDDDADDENATLAHRAAGGGYDGVEKQLLVMVLDNDEVGLEVSPMTLLLTEGEPGKTFTVRLGAAPTDQVMVSIRTDAALQGRAATSTLSLTFTDANWGMSQSVTVMALDDADSADASGEVVLVASGGGYGGQSGSIRVDVRDDDVPYRVGLTSSSVQVVEGAGPARYQVRLNRQNETAVMVRYTTRDESAHAGLDYVRPVSNMLSFEAGGNLETWINVPILDDALHEEEETFTLELVDAQGAELGTAIGRVIIVDNDGAPTVSVTPAAYVREGGSANIFLRLSNVSTKPVPISYSTSDVTATAVADYEAVSARSVTIEPGETGTVIQVPTRDDAVHEGREAFMVQLDGGDRTIVTILDNDRLPQLSIGDVTVSEDGGRAKLAVSLSGASAVRVGVAFATQDGTAKAGADYTRALGTLVFAPGETVRDIWVPVARDDVVEEDEGFVVRLSAPEHAAVLDAEGNVTIKDDPIEVSIYDGTGTESLEELVMAVRLSLGSTKVVSVQFAVTGGTATSDVDYESTQGLVVFETGSTEAQVRIPLIDDDLQEGDETIEVTLSNPTNAQIGQAVATGTIVDDETAPGVQVRAIAVSQSEAVFVVGLLAPVAERMTGNYRTVDGTAWAGEDYERMEGVLEFGPGETRKEVRVPLLRAQGSGEAFALMVRLGDETVREEVVLGSKDTGTRARLGRSVAVHIVEAVSERMEGSLVGCMPRPFPGQRVRASHLLSGCGMQASGERLSVWGRGAYSRLQSGGVSGADVVTASLGADYRAGGRWLMGMVVSRSEALEEEGTLLQMMGWYPYVRYGGMRHSVWGLAGAGQGVAEAADTGIRLMAAGVGGTLVRRAGARLGYEADGFWLGMDGGIGVSRVRAGLEGSVTLQDILEPYVEAAVLHSGGDAERGMGMEAGGGLRVRMGMLHAEVMSRRLVLHQEDGYGEWGYAGMVRYGGMEGLGAQLRPTWGRTHVGTLWQAERPWEVYSSDRRMELEVGYGSRVHRRSVLRPHVGMGLRDRGRDYRIGAGVQGRTGLGFSVSGLAMEHIAPYQLVSYGVTASGYVRW